MTHGHHLTKPDDSRQQTHHAKAIGHHPHSNRDSQTIPCGGRQATHRGHKMPPDQQEAFRKCGGNGHWARGCRNQRLLFCWICGKVERRLLPTIGKWPAISAAERRAGISQCHLSKRTRWQVKLADGRCGGIDAQFEVEVKFGNKQVTMSLLILPGVVDPLVLG